VTTAEGENREILEPVDAVGQLQRQVDDLTATMMARLVRRPTGDIEPTIRQTAKPDTLILNGALVSRDTYKVLWQWVQEQGLVMTGLFTSGNGTTTFGLPDFRGRVLAGADTTYPLGTKFGSREKPLTGGQLPAHSHSGTTAGDSPSHTHYSWGSHSGHHTANAPGASGAGPAAWPTTSWFWSGDVGWSGNASGAHFHGFSTSVVGSTDDINFEQQSIAVNWLIWT